MTGQDPDEYCIECFGPWIGSWHFISRLHGLTKAVELAAVMREIKGAPTRVVPAPELRRAGVPVCTVRE
jgi:hypothetical protein